MEESTNAASEILEKKLGKFELLLALSHIDLGISEKSLNVYRSHLRTSKGIQIEMDGEREYLSRQFITRISQMSIELRMAIGFTPGVQSATNKYLKYIEIESHKKASITDEKPNRIISDTTVLAIESRSRMKSAALDPYKANIDPSDHNSTVFFDKLEKNQQHLSDKSRAKDKGVLLYFYGSQNKALFKEEDKAEEVVLPINLSSILDLKESEKYLNFHDERSGTTTTTQSSYLNLLERLLSKKNTWFRQYDDLYNFKNNEAQLKFESIGRIAFLERYRIDSYLGVGGANLERFEALARSKGDFIQLLDLSEYTVYTHVAREAYCDTLREEIKNLNNSVKKRIAEIGMSRHSMYPIMPLLKLDNPLQPIFDALEIQANDIECWIKQAPTLEHARILREHLIVILNTICPFRRKQWLNITWRNDNTAELKMTEEGDWSINILLNDLKNRHSSHIRRLKRISRWVTVVINRKIHDRLTRFINEYCFRYLPLLNLGGDRLFVNSPKNLNQIRTMIVSWYDNYLKPLCDSRGIYDVLPFGPHAFRHLTVTTLLKLGAGIDTAAGLLLDDPATVLFYYSAFLPTDALKNAIVMLDHLRASAA
ncbi:hypothetical protein [Deinococcus sp. UYEF24]